MFKQDILLQEGTIKPEEQLRVANLNVLNAPAYAEERFKRLYLEVKRIQPDILQIQEANFILCETLINRIKDECGFIAMGQTKNVNTKNEGITSANATFVKQDAQFEELPTFPMSNRFLTETVPTLITKTKFNGCDVYLFNVHLAWGGFSEPMRLKQVLQVEAQANSILLENPDAIIVLSGDFNAPSSSTTVNFLTGKHIADNTSTYWVDAWEMLGNSENEITTEMSTILNINTALDVGIAFPSLIPARRIDYIFVKEWAYGRQGSPINFIRWADHIDENKLAISDHYGVAADLLIKPKQ